jgi:wyosine [tRNA(Phe)-imidazoG37] synthetase (radical SAM superfamily)
MKLIYGPVQSQRYGLTLGVNPLGDSKVCSYNCAYCSLGPTTLTMNKIRKEYEFPTLDQIRAAFRENVQSRSAYKRIVVSGNGEPTLHPEFDTFMQMLVSMRDEHFHGLPITVLTNGAHLDNKHVIAGLNRADERVVKFDAGTDVMMNRVNDPLVRINVSKFISHFNKLKDFTVQSIFFTGPIDNSTNEAIEEWIEVLGMIKPQLVQIQTLTRPPMNPALKALEDDALYAIAFKLKKRTSLEIQVFGAEKT